MKIEVKSVKVLLNASEETLCFEAKLFVDGVACGIVSNSGHGGSNRYSDHTVEKRIDAYAATLPPLMVSGEPLTQNADLLIGEMVEMAQAAKQLKGLIAKRLIVREVNGEVTQTKAVAADVLARWLADPSVLKRTADRGGIVLNNLPFDEALRLFTDMPTPDFAPVAATGLLKRA